MRLKVNDDCKCANQHNSHANQKRCYRTHRRTSYLTAYLDLLPYCKFTTKSSVTDT